MLINHISYIRCDSMKNFACFRAYPEVLIRYELYLTQSRVEPRILINISKIDL